MADAVLAGDGLDAVAALTAEATGGTVAIVLPAVGAAAAGAGGERRLGAVRRFVAARLAGQPGALPEGYVADAAVGSDGEKVGAVVLLDDGRAPAPGAQAVLRLPRSPRSRSPRWATQGPTGRGPRAPCSRTSAARRRRLARRRVVHGANMNAAAAAIPSHRHTVAYRLDRLRELTGLHPGRADDRERLGLGVKARLVLDALSEVR